MGKKLKKILWAAFLCGNIIVTVCYLLACLVPFLNPGKYWFVALPGLVFPILFFVILAFCLYWMIKRSKWTFLSLVALLLSWKQISVSFGFNAAATFKEAKAPGAIRILTWNLSSWGETSKSNEFQTNYRNEMISTIKRTHADVLCFQEYLFNSQIQFRDSVIPELKKEGFEYSYFVKARYTFQVYKTAHITGAVILSRYPITDTTHFEYNENDFAEPLIYADIKVDHKVIRVFTTHLQSVRFDDYDYNALYSLKQHGKPNITQSKAVIGKLKQAYKKRSEQAELIHEKIQESPYPVLLCGDFNDVPNSYTYFTIKNGLKDVFIEKGLGLGRTYQHISPTLRIDYILADKKFKVQQYKKIKVPYSDHYPVIADIILEATN